MRERAGLLVVPVFAVLAAVGGWFVLGGVDTGPEVEDTPALVRLPPLEVSAPDEVARGEEEDTETLEPEPEATTASARASAPPPGPVAPPPRRPPEGLASNPLDRTDRRPGPAPIHPLAAERMHAAAVQATSRRVDMLERMFDAASLAVPDAGDREDVARVLDDALGRMRRLAARVDGGEIDYRDAVTEMDAIRDDAASRVEEIVPADEAEAVKVRMGMRTPFTRRATPAEWTGVPFEEDGGSW